MRRLLSAFLASCLVSSGGLAQTTHKFEYDARGRLIQACKARPGDAQLTDYGLDPADNRTLYKNNKVDVLLPPGSGIFSPNGRFGLWMQGDGNLVHYKTTDSGWTYAGWNSATHGSGANVAAFQNDGNLVVYAPQGSVWSSGTWGNDCASIVVQDDGNVVIRSRAGAVLWQTGTGGQ